MFSILLIAVLYMSSSIQDGEHRRLHLFFSQKDFQENQRTYGIKILPDSEKRLTNKLLDRVA